MKENHDTMNFHAPARPRRFFAGALLSSRKRPGVVRAPKP
jgi:hypothetical protein